MTPELRMRLASMALKREADARGVALARLADKASAMGADFGTINSKHTLSEVGELVAAKDFERDQIQNASKANADSIVKKDPTWQADWNAYLDRYSKARFPVMFKVGAAGLAGGGITAEDSWNEILATQVVDRNAGFSDRDPQGLFNRLQKIGVKVDLSKIPQPKEVDLDLETLKTADAAAKQVEAAARAAREAAAALAKAGKDKVAETVPWWVWLLGGSAVVGVGYVAYRTSPVGMAIRAAVRR